MINQQFKNAIEEQLQQGQSREQITESMSANGWSTAEIEAAFQEIALNPKTTKLKPKHKKTKIIILGIFMILLAGPLCFYGVARLLFVDIKPIDDSDLRWQKVVIADSDNAFFDLKKIDAVIYSPAANSQLINDMAKNKNWDDKLAEELVTKNVQAFVYFSDAAAKPGYQNPETADPAKYSVAAPLPPTLSITKIAKLESIKAIYLSKQGKSKESYDEALKMINVSQKIQDSKTTIIEYLTAIIMKDIGLEAIQQILLSSQLSSGDLIEYSNKLEFYLNNTDGLVSAFKYEYIGQSWTVDQFTNGSLSVSDLGNMKSTNNNVSSEKNATNSISSIDNFSFQPNKTKLLFANRARAMINNTNNSCVEPAENEIKPLSKSGFFGSIKENSKGLIIYDISNVSYSSIITRGCEERLLLNTTVLMTAIKAYQIDTENYPATLTDLVPKYLISVPLDPFDKKPLRYSATNKTIYSIGKDMKDSGGSTGDDWRKMSDPTFLIVEG